MPALRAGGRRRPSLLGLALVVLLALLGVAALKSHRELAEAGERRDELVERLAQARARNAVLKDRIERLESDSHALEHLARTLGLAKPDEIVWYYAEVEEETPAAAEAGEPPPVDSSLPAAVPAAGPPTS